MSTCARSVEHFWITSRFWKQAHAFLLCFSPIFGYIAHDRLTVYFALPSLLTSDPWIQFSPIQWIVLFNIYDRTPEIAKFKVPLCTRVGDTILKNNVFVFWIKECINYFITPYCFLLKCTFSLIIIPVLYWIALVSLITIPVCLSKTVRVKLNKWQTILITEFFQH